MAHKVGISIKTLQNRADLIGGCVESIINALEVAKVEYQIMIIADYFSTWGSPKVFHEYQKEPFKVAEAYFRHQQFLALEDCDIIGFIDDDVVLNPEYFLAAFELFHHPVGVLCGTSDLFAQEILGIPSIIDDVTFVPTIRDNFLVRVSDMEQVGGVDRRLGIFYDIDLMFRLQTKYGVTAVTSPYLRAIKPLWRMPGGFNTESRHDTKTDSALTLLRQYPQAYSMTNSGKHPDGWHLHADINKLKSLQLKHEFNEISRR